jgi:hypothetical protein
MMETFLFWALGISEIIDQSYLQINNSDKYEGKT